MHICASGRTVGFGSRGFVRGTCSWRRPLCRFAGRRFLTDYEPGVTADLAQAFASSGKSQLSVMEVDGPDISKYGVVVPNGTGAGIAGLVEKPDADDAPLNLASIGRYVLTPDIFDT